MAAYSSSEVGDLLTAIEAVLFTLDIRSKKCTWFSDRIHGLLDPDSSTQLSHHARMMQSCHPEDRDFCSKIVTHLSTSQERPVQLVIRLRYGDGHWRWLFLSCQEIRNNEKEEPMTVAGIIIPLVHGCIDRHAIDHVVDMIRKIRSSSIECLTMREKQVLSMIARGYTCAAIANELSISFHTADTYRKRLLRKLNAPNIAALGALAGAWGLT
ncbi:MAG TPA: helix-turn-helix transcriptional regulator [Bacteroidales bacterium]|nr:helix-turn-helix transcriptional regulator [Bacteroidales bacterium]